MGQASEKIKAQRAAEARQRRRRNWLIGGGTAIVIAAASTGIALATSGGSGAGSGSGSSVIGPEGVAIPSGSELAGTSSSTTGQTIDGIACQASEQTVYHIHAHLTIYVNGKAKQVPAGIGIPGAQATQTSSGAFISSGTCFYWLHTHAADGIIHVESPTEKTYTLGNFFDIWGQPLSSSQVGPATGKVTVYVNGKVYTGNPRDITLTAHEQIQLEVGTPTVSPVSITFPNGL